MKSSGLQQKRIDLHFHTPGSKDYRQRSATAEQIVSRASQEGLDAIAVTDHNTGVWVDRIKAAASKVGITVFPGVEVTVAGGERNVHLLAIFDSDTGTAHVHDFLAQVLITEASRGDTNALAKGEVNEVIQVIVDNDGIALLAHCDSTSGVTQEMKGQARIRVIRNPNLLGAEITKDETQKFFSGDDPDYQRRLAVFRGSDCHEIDQIGRRFTHFKVGTFSINALRQCLYDPGTRIRIADIEPQHYPKIEEMTIDSGFFDGHTFSFHPALNTLLGGKGVGKSLIIEYLRFALAQPSDVPAIIEDHKGKLAKQLRIGGKVTVTFVTASGSRFKIERTYDDVDNPIEVTDLATSLKYEGDIPRLLPILAYSQNEIIDISRDIRTQLSLIDRFVDVDPHKRSIENVGEKLKRNCSAYIAARAAAEKVQALGKDIATMSTELEEIDRILDNPMFKQKRVWDRRDLLVQEIRAHATDVSNTIEEVVEIEDELKVPEISDEDLPETLLVGYRDSVVSAVDGLVAALKAAFAKYGADISATQPKRTAWMESLAIFDAQFKAFLAEAGGEQEAISAKRTSLAHQLEQLREQLQQLDSQASRFSELSTERQSLLDSLEAAANELYRARSDVYAGLTDKSEGRLLLRLKEGADRSDYRNALDRLVQGLNIQQRFRDSIVDGISPREFVSAVLDKDNSKLEDLGGLTPASAMKIVDSLPASEQSLGALLALPYEHMSHDEPEILFQKDDGKYYALGELSVGQKCTAFLLIALSEGSMPVVIDQPEDALDVASVYLDVVQRLRAGKDQRQFIITTHNPNVAVSSDSDKYHVFRSSATSGELVCAGSIDLAHVAEAVLNHLEGGVDAYQLRGRKYNIG